MTQPQAAQWNAQLLEHLQQHKIKATLFPSLARLGGKDALELVASWSEQRHWVGNQTARHKSLADPTDTLEDFIADVELADVACKDLPTFPPEALACSFSL
ncbi:MAG: polysaccharide deacetylase family protein [Alcaligenes sp.]